MAKQTILFMRRLPQSAALAPELRSQKIPVTKKMLRDNLLSFSQQQKIGVFTSADHQIFIADLKNDSSGLLDKYATYCLHAGVSTTFYKDFLEAMGRKEFLRAMNKNFLCSSGPLDCLARLFKTINVLLWSSFSHFVSGAERYYQRLQNQ